MYLNNAYLAMKKHRKKVKPIHRMYLNCKTNENANEFISVKPIHRMYLNQLRHLKSEIKILVKPIHRMYLN